MLATDRRKKTVVSHLANGRWLAYRESSTVLLWSNKYFHISSLSK